MSIKALNLIETQYAPSGVTTLYTVPAGTTTIIDNFSACNGDTGGAHTLTIYIVPSGQTYGAAYAVCSAYSIAASTAVNVPSMQTQILSAGDFIAVIASAASDIVIRASGRQVT